ncbi:hypothetical protein Tsubulata_006721 [Turnera subulata]|uniref:Mitochondrial import inner membrane translocase subunit Tim21 n=1 Tax=Turnera subulata TaxID=218843 RepID=A0A9Q0GIN4_9ROSI|nr:hypothetical protein Tsubulata_006721 [Turnera subulata]
MMLRNLKRVVGRSGSHLKSLSYNLAGDTNPSSAPASAWASLIRHRSTSISPLTKPISPIPSSPHSLLPRPSYLRDIANANQVSKETLRTTGIARLHGGLFARESTVSLRSPFQLKENYGASAAKLSVARSFASKASNQAGKNQSEARKEVSTVEDPFDAPTYNIPEKPVTFVEGASYSVIILAGLGVAAAAAYAVFKELIFQPKEYMIFDKALKRIQDDSQVRVRIGSPITGYGQESRNRAARQRIPNKIFKDEDGVEHVQVNFHIRGPHGAGKVAAEMFRDKVDRQWKYTYLIVEISQPTRAQLILESYMPA